MGRPRTRAFKNKHPEFAKKIQDLLTVHKMNQSELAKLIPCRPLSVSLWVSGERTPTLEWQRKRLCEIFNVTSDWLFHSEGPRPIVIPRQIMDSLEQLDSIKQSLTNFLSEWKNLAPKK